MFHLGVAAEYFRARGIDPLPDDVLAKLDGMEVQLRLLFDVPLPTRVSGERAWFRVIATTPQLRGRLVSLCWVLPIQPGHELVFERRHVLAIRRAE